MNGGKERHVCKGVFCSLPVQKLTIPLQTLYAVLLLLPLLLFSDADIHL